MRYIDDLLALNNSGFASRATDIYQSELVLKKTTEGPTESSYFDLLIEIYKDIVSKYKCSVRKHIAEGICLPLSVAALNKHIATRRR